MLFRKVFKSLSNPRLLPYSQGFCSSQPPENSTFILAKHLKNLRQLHYDSIRMKPPKDKIVQVEGKRLNDLGFMKSFGEFAKSISTYSIKDIPNIEGANTPSASWVGMNFPVSVDPFIRNTFKKFYTDGIRVGKLMEILDLIGATSAYRYMKLDILSRDATVVTICVDHFHIFEEVISTDRDLFISSYVSFAGNSSLEVRIDVTYTDAPEKLVATAFYVFAARDAKDYSKAKRVPKFVFDGEFDQDGCLLRYEYGKENMQERKEGVAKSAFKVSPTAEESQHLHSIFKQTLIPENAKKYVPIPETASEKTMLMHLQDKNIHGKVFGGFLLREACDLAWTTAYLYGGGSYPDFVHIDDVAFLSPVEIGSVATFKSKVTYVEGNLLHVMITVDTMRSRLEKDRTCEFHMTLSHPHLLPEVVPHSYFDGMAYIEGQRRIKSMRHFEL